MVNGLRVRFFDGYLAENASLAPLSEDEFECSTIVSDFSDLVLASAGKKSASSLNYTLQWTGFFYANSSRKVDKDGFSWGFTLTSDDVAYLWLGDKAVDSFSVANADLAVAASESSFVATLDDDLYYPIRIIFGNNHVGAGDFSLKWTPPCGTETSLAANFLSTPAVCCPPPTPPPPPSLPPPPPPPPCKPQLLSSHKPVTFADFLGYFEAALNALPFQSHVTP